LESWKPKLLVYLPHLECAIYEKLNWIHGHVGPLASFAMFYPLPLHGLKELGISKTSYVAENFLDPQNYEVKKPLNFRGKILNPTKGLFNGNVTGGGGVPDPGGYKIFP
jgi:hypothetical protein